MSRELKAAEESLETSHVTSQKEEKEGRRRGEERKKKVDEEGQTAPRRQEHVLEQPETSHMPQQSAY